MRRPRRRSALSRSIPLLAVMLLTGALGGCGPFKLPDLPTPIDTPSTQVRAVRLVESSNRAGRYRIVVHLQNPNDIPLPMVHADYRLRVGQRATEDTFVPAATIPAEGEMTIELPAVLADGGTGRGPYEVTGTVFMRPEGEVRRVLYQLGVPLPSAPFEGSGNVQVISGAMDGSPQQDDAQAEGAGEGDGGGDADAEHPGDGASGEAGSADNGSGAEGSGNDAPAGGDADADPDA